MAIFPADEILSPNKGAIILRSLSKEDAAAFRKFLPEIAKDSQHTMQYIGGKIGSLAEQELRITLAEEDPLKLMLGLFDQSELIGFLHCKPVWEEHPWVRHIAEFAMMIRKNYWGMGLGKALLKKQDEHIESASFTRLQATVRIQNERAIKLYEKAGFQIEGSKKNAVQIDGNYFDEYYIAKLF